MTKTTPGGKTSLSGINAAFDNIETLGSLRDAIDIVISHKDNQDAIRAIQNRNLRNLVTTVYNAAYETLTSRIIHGHDTEGALIGFAATIRDLSETHKIDFSPENKPDTLVQPLDQEESLSEDDLKDIVGYDHIIKRLDGIKDDALRGLANTAVNQEIKTISEKIERGTTLQTAHQEFNAAMKKLSDICRIDILPPFATTGPDIQP